MAAKLSIVLVGAGAMGGALLRGWLEKGIIDPRRSMVVDPAPLGDAAAAAARAGLPIAPRPSQTVADALVVAVKPQSAAAALADLAPFAARALVLSVMAGQTIASLRAALPPDAEIVRAMPNLPAAVGMGVTALHAPIGVASERRAVAARLMGAVGATIWLDDERDIDAATAISGSGPAYFFLLGAALSDAGAALGLPAEAAAKLARLTLIGAGAYARQSEGSLESMIAQVASPGGTTAAALSVLDGDEKQLRTLVKRAAAAAARRASELSG
jgi:pyrroline-5-carboxylate reductase